MGNTFQHSAALMKEVRDALEKLITHGSKIAVHRRLPTRDVYNF
jgi:ribosomal protein L17